MHKEKKTAMEDPFIQCESVLHILRTPQEWQDQPSDYTYSKQYLDAPEQVLGRQTLLGLLPKGLLAF